MKNIIIILFAFTISCSLSSLTIAQGTLGEYPGAGVGFDAGCAYPDAGNSDPGVSDVGLTGNVCGSAFDVTFGTWVENTGGALPGFDLSGFELNNYDIDQEAVYGVRLFYGPQNDCCTICLDAMLDLTQAAGTACGTFGPQASLYSFGFPVPATYGQDIFGEPLIPYEDMCPNTEYFAQYQFILASALDTSDPDGNFCAMDDALLTNFGTQSTVQTLVAPGTRDALVINSSSLTVAAGTDCMSTEILLDFSLDVTAGCTVSFGTCSQGLDFQFQSTLACGTTFNSGTILNDDPTPCLIGLPGMPFTGQISLGSGQSVCDILACDPAASIDVYAFFDFCEADDINGDGSGNDEDVFTIDLASALAGIDCTNCAACAITPDAATNIVCNDNGTPFDDSDDTYTFDIVVNGSNTNAGASGTFNDDQGSAGIAYGSTVSYGPFPISGGAITVNFTDVDDGMCTASMMATPPATCSDAVCTITPEMATNIVCDDAGTPEDPNDDTFTFDIEVNGSNTAAGASNTFNDDQGNSGIAYGTVQGYGPYPISGGDVTVAFTDADEASCTGMMMAAAPATCSNTVACPPATVTDTAAEVCSGALSAEFTDWQAAVEAANPNDTPVDGVSTGVVYSSVNDSAAPDGDVSGVTGSNMGCDAADQIVYAFSGCDTSIPVDGAPDIYIFAGTFTLTVYPALTATDVSSPADCGTLQIDLLAADGTVCVSETQACIADGDILSFDFTGTVTDPQSCSTLSATTAACSGCGVCEDGISGSVVSEEVGCSVEGIEVTIYDSTGAVVGTVMTDANGDYMLPGVYACGSYSAELTANVPDCFTGSGGMTGPIGFSVNGDGNPDGADFEEVGEVPTLSQWGLMILALLMMTFGALKIGAVSLRTTKSRK